MVAHDDYRGVPRESRVAETLLAADELSGFVIAVALVRPSRAIGDVDVPSVLKKMKDKAFARAVRREDITRGAEELGVPLEEHVGLVIQSLQGIASDLGLEGTQSAGGPPGGGLAGHGEIEGVAAGNS